MIYLITLLVAYCSIVYELLMAQTLSVLMGNTVMRYSITIGIYLASLGLGAMLCERGHEKDTSRRLVRVEIWLKGRRPRKAPIGPEVSRGSTSTA